MLYSASRKEDMNQSVKKTHDIREKKKQYTIFGTWQKPGRVHYTTVELVFETFILLPSENKEEECNIVIIFWGILPCCVSSLFTQHFSQLSSVYHQAKCIKKIHREYFIEWYSSISPPVYNEAMSSTLYIEQCPALYRRD